MYMKEDPTIHRVLWKTGSCHQGYEEFAMLISTLRSAYSESLLIMKAMHQYVFTLNDGDCTMLYAWMCIGHCPHLKIGPEMAQCFNAWK